MNKISFNNDVQSTCAIYRAEIVGIIAIRLKVKMQKEKNVRQ